MSASPADTLELMANMLDQPLSNLERQLFQAKLRAVSAQVRRQQLALDDVVQDAQRAEMVRQLPPRLRVVR